MKLDMVEKEITSANILRVAVGSTGLCGGDYSHGGKTKIVIEDLSSTDINCWWDYENKKLTINLGGDCELQTILEGLEFIIKHLQNKIDQTR